jgi:hypothetical protein
LVEGFEAVVHLLDVIAATAVECGYSKGRKEDEETGFAMGRESGAKGRRH